MLITPNLAGAIRHFRFDSCLRWIWADAICIDQMDPAEKTFQIPLMADIYRSASQVMVCLGEKDEDMQLLRDMRAAHRTIESRGALSI